MSPLSRFPRLAGRMRWRVELRHEDASIETAGARTGPFPAMTTAGCSAAIAGFGIVTASMPPAGIQPGGVFVYSPDSICASGIEEIAAVPDSRSSRNRTSTCADRLPQICLGGCASTRTPRAPGTPAMRPVFVPCMSKEMPASLSAARIRWASNGSAPKHPVRQARHLLGSLYPLP